MASAQLSSWQLWLHFSTSLQICYSMCYIYPQDDGEIALAVPEIISWPGDERERESEPASESELSYQVLEWLINQPAKNKKVKPLITVMVWTKS